MQRRAGTLSSSSLSTLLVGGHVRGRRCLRRTNDHPSIHPSITVSVVHVTFLSCSEARVTHKPRVDRLLAYIPFEIAPRDEDYDKLTHLRETR
mmetsp:Transcript_13235/g.22522  ORF Transcript_13235/g.22522 Transcript_13235/m.22522 type:complete len:93 (-) Transcript_13235:1414-1692(-)